MGQDGQSFKRRRRTITLCTRPIPIMVNSSVFTDVEGLFAANDDVGKVAASIQQSY